MYEHNQQITSASDESKKLRNTFPDNFVALSWRVYAETFVVIQTNIRMRDFLACFFPNMCQSDKLPSLSLDEVFSMVLRMDLISS